jgi:hypothetical protein
MINIKKVKNIPELIANDIEETLGSNHISTSIYGSPVSDKQRDILEDSSKKKDAVPPIKLFIVVKKFDESCLVKLSLVFSKWKKRVGDRLESPIITEPEELQGILDSVPEKILDLKNNYRVLAGDDLQELSAEPEYEYLRAQVELAIRHHVYSLRHDLFDVLFKEKSMEDYLKQLWVYCIGTLRNYHRLVKPDLKSTQEHIQAFYEEFPQGKPPISDLLEKFYQVLNNRPVDSIGKANLFKLSIGIMSDVLQPMLLKVDNMGPKKTYMDSVDIPTDDLLNNKIELKIKSADRALKEKIQSALKVRDRELQKRVKLFIDRYKSEYRKRVEEEVNRIKKHYDEKYEKDMTKLEKELTERIEINTANSLESKISKEQDKLKRDLKQVETDLKHEYNKKEKELKRVYKQKTKEFKKGLLEKDRKLTNAFKAKEKGIIEKMKLREKKNIEQLKQKAKKEYEELAEKLKNEIDMKKKEIEMRKQLEDEIFEKKEDMKKLLELQIECEKFKLESKRLEFDLSLKDKELDYLKQHKPKYIKSRHEVEPTLQKDDIDLDFSMDNDEDIFKKILNKNKSLN